MGYTGSRETCTSEAGWLEDTDINLKHSTQGPASSGPTHLSSSSPMSVPEHLHFCHHDPPIPASATLHTPCSPSGTPSLKMLSTLHLLVKLLYISQHSAKPSFPPRKPSLIPFPHSFVLCLDLAHTWPEACHTE